MILILYISPATGLMIFKFLFDPVSVISALVVSVVAISQVISEPSLNAVGVILLAPPPPLPNVTSIIFPAASVARL